MVPRDICVVKNKGKTTFALFQPLFFQTTTKLTECKSPQKKSLLSKISGSRHADADANSGARKRSRDQQPSRCSVFSCWGSLFRSVSEQYRGKGTMFPYFRRCRGCSDWPHWLKRPATVWTRKFSPSWQFLLRRHLCLTPLVGVTVPTVVSSCFFFFLTRLFFFV